MKNKIKILLVEDSPDDIELMLHELKKGKIDFITEVVQSKKAYCQAISNFIPDIILSDYSLPSFSGKEAFAIREQMAPSTPFIFVSGSIGEEKSIDYIRNGVTDYVLKDKLFTLTVKVKRAMSEAAERQEKKRAEQQLMHNTGLLERAQQLAHMGSWELKFSDNKLVLSKEGCRIFGFAPSEDKLCFETWSSLVHPEDLDMVMETIQRSRETLTESSYSHRIILKDGSIRDIYSESKFEFDSNGDPTGLYGIMQDITEPKKGEVALRNAYQEKNTVLERIDDGFFAINKEAIVTYWNKKAEFLLDTRKEDVLGKNLHEVFAATASIAFYNHYQYALTNNKTVHFEEYSVRMGKWFEVSAYASDDGLSVYFKDVSERKISGDKLKESELRYRSIIDQATDAICIADPSMKILDINVYGCDLLGYSKMEFLKLTIADLFLAEDIAADPFKLEELKTGKIIRNERRFKTKQGALIDIELSARILEDGRFIIFGHDIAERKKAIDKIKESELRYRSLNEQATDAICITDGTMKFIDINPYACEIFGYSKEEALQLSLPDILFIEDLAANPLKTAELQLGKTIRNERRLKRKNGTAINMEVSTKIMEDGRLIMFGHDITERKISEALISESEKKYRQIVETCQEGIWLIDEENKTTFVNKKMTEMLGYTENEMIGRTNLSFKDEGEQKKALEQIERRKKGQGEIHEAKFITSSGRIVWTNVSTNPIFKEDGTYAGALAMMTDITERKRAEQEMGWLINNTEESFILLNRNLEILSFNKQFKELYAMYLGKAVAKGDSILDYAQADRRNSVKQIYERVLDGLEEYSEVVIPLKNGSVKNFAIKYKPAKNEEGKIIGVFVSAIDITEKKKSEEQLIINEKRYRALVENGADGAAILSPEGQLHYVSPTVERILGYPEDEIMKLDMFSLIHPDDIAGAAKVWEQALANPGMPVPGHTSQMLHRDGSWRWLEATVTNMLHDPALNGIVDNFRDVTEKKELENLLNRANTLARIGSWEVDLVGNTLYWSSITREIHEVEEDFFPDLQTAINFYKEGESRDLITDALRLAVNKGIPWDIELQIVTAKNNEKWIRTIGEAEFKNGNCKKVSGSFQDITERKVSEIHLLELNENIRKHAKELAISNAELEQFAYVASHDLQEPLRMITSFLTQLEKRYSSVLDDKGKKYIDFAVGGAKRMRQIILDLLDFSRVGQNEESMTDLDLNEVVSQIQILFQKKVEERNAVITVDSLPHLYGHRAPLHQVFQNLIGNALKYSTAGKPCKIQVSVYESAGEWQFAVADNGIGIATEYYDKIFIIFQRLHNKDEYSGTGMGLAVTKKIIENLGGKIWVESTEGKGSTFYFTLKK